MRKLIYGMNMTLDGYIAAPGDDIGWGGPPSDELFRWWLDREQETGLSLYGRKLWEVMSSYWPTGDQQPNATPPEIEFARNWREMPKVVFSSTIEKVGWNARLVTGDAVSEIKRLKMEDGAPMSIGGPMLAGAKLAQEDRRGAGRASVRIGDTGFLLASMRPRHHLPPPQHRGDDPSYPPSAY